MGGHAATPNSETTETMNPTSQNPTATYPGTRYGKGGKVPISDSSNECKIVG